MVEQNMTSNIQNIDSLTALKLLENNVPFIDVREIEEWNQSHIKGAVHLPLSLLLGGESWQDYPKDQEYLIYCRSGTRSLNACYFLEEKGFTKLYNLEGGILTWEHTIKDYTISS